MFALLAFGCFLLALFHLGLPVDLVVLGLTFVALHLMWGWAPWTDRNRQP